MNFFLFICIIILLFSWVPFMIQTESFIMSFLQKINKEMSTKLTLLPVPLFRTSD